MKVYSQIVLVRSDGTLILRHHDVAPGHGHTGFITTIGDECQGDESPRETAVRALNEQTNLAFDASDLVFFNEYPMHVADPTNHSDDQVYFFTAHHIAPRGLGIFGGRGFALVHSQTEANRLNLEPFVQRMVSDYYHEIGKRRGARLHPPA